MVAVLRSDLVCSYADRCCHDLDVGDDAGLVVHQFFDVSNRCECSGKHQKMPAFLLCLPRGCSLPSQSASWFRDFRGVRIFTEPRHWLIQTVGLSLWAIAWTFISALLHRRDVVEEDVPAGHVALQKSSGADIASQPLQTGMPPLQTDRWRWLVSAYPRVDQVVLHVWSLFFGGLLVTSLANGSFAELFREGTIWFSLASEQNWVMVALATLSLAMLFLFVEQPTEFKAAAIIVLWTLAWAIGAMQFEASMFIRIGVALAVTLGRFGCGGVDRIAAIGFAGVGEVS